MKAPQFSIIIPALNEEKFLPRLLESLVVQSEKNFEVIVVDGKSKDGTVAAANSFKKKLPSCTVTISPIQSLPEQRNLGASIARGEWLVFVDADSILLPYFLCQIASYVADFSPDFFTSWMRPDSEEMGDAILVLFWNLVLEGLIRIKRQLAPGPLTIVKRTLFNEIGGYDRSHDFNEDVDFSLRMYRHGIPLKILRETLYIVSLRRLRAQGKLRVAQQYVQASLPILFLNRSLSKMPGYIMGGHLYDKKKKPIGISVIRSFNKQLKKLRKEMGF